MYKILQISDIRLLWYIMYKKLNFNFTKFMKNSNFDPKSVVSTLFNILKRQTWFYAEMQKFNFKSSFTFVLWQQQTSRFCFIRKQWWLFAEFFRLPHSSLPRKLFLCGHKKAWVLKFNLRSLNCLVTSSQLVFYCCCCKI